MKKLIAMGLLIFASTSFAMPTTAQKIDCLKKEMHWILPQGFTLIENSIDLKQSYGVSATLTAPGNLVSSAVSGAKVKVQYANFAAEKDGKIIKGWVYLFSRNFVPVNFVGALGQCEVRESSTNKSASIELGGNGIYK